jgi:hypothetical protein
MLIFNVIFNVEDIKLTVVRVLQVMVKQEIYRRMGYVIQADEEQLRTQFETIQAELNAPTRFKVCKRHTAGNNTKLTKCFNVLYADALGQK